MDFFEQLGSTLGLNSITRILAAIIIFLICYIAIRIVMKIVDKLFAKSAKLDSTVSGFIRTAINIALWALAIVIVAGALGIPTASLVAVVSIAGLALSLAVQGIMGNVFSGLTLLLTRPFEVGQYCEVGANAGYIKKIDLFYTTLITLDNRIISIPNSDVTASTVVNYNANTLRRVDMTYSASYDCATEDVKAALYKAIAMTDKVVSDEAPFVAISGYGPNFMEYTCRAWCKSEDYWDVYFGLNENVRKAYAENGIKLSFAHVNVHMMDK
ncbi:MAG: mechanosensitive ion channel family protein [Oscillospiraceae bacterium]|nr:mechanosensitive ion channel family protein [Oscillospiraceae bacterium]